MAQAYYYSNTAVTTALSGSITAGATSLTVDSVSGFPGDFPYILKLDGGTPSEELVKVTAASGETLTVERGFGGTSGQSHSMGAEVKHVYNAQDATDFRLHEEATTNVHGVIGELVGTANAQTLASKTLTAPVINSGELNGSFSGDPTLTGDLTLTGKLSSAQALETDRGMEVLVSGETHPRLVIAADGSLYFGDGSSDPVVTPIADAAVIRRIASNVLGTSALWRITRPETSNNALSIRTGSESASRLVINADGRMLWGTGSGSLDTNLYRSGADSLRSDDRFNAMVEETNSGLVVASGWDSSATPTFRRTCGIASWSIQVTRTGSNINATSAGNIADVQIATIPAGYRPAVNTIAPAGDGFGMGDVAILTSGVINLRTWSSNGTIQPGRNIRVSATYIL